MDLVMIRTLRFRAEGKLLYGRVEGERVEVLDDAPWHGGRPTGASEALPSIARVCPVEPTKIVCIGRNYRAHAEEVGGEVPAEPLLFFKPPSALIGPDETVRLPPESQESSTRASWAS